MSKSIHWNKVPEIFPTAGLETGDSRRKQQLEFHLVRKLQQSSLTDEGWVTLRDL